MSVHAIELKGVSKWYPGHRPSDRLEVVKNIDLVIPNSQEGEFVVFLGPSGCGKSTLLHIISGMLEADSGEVMTLGEPVDGPNPYSATVPQAYTCYPWLTVLGNVQFGLNIRGMKGKECRECATDYLSQVGLGDRLNAYPRELSGGMQQRVAIARTLAMQPKIVLMDEPFGALDAQTRIEMQHMLLKLWQREKNIIVFVTHDINEALLLADRILVFSARPAQIIRDEKIAFGRPRATEQLYSPEFMALSKQLLEELHHI